MPALLFGGIVLVQFFVRLFWGSADSAEEREFLRLGEYFTPRLVYADRQLQALSLRVKGDYKRGVLDWESFADHRDLLGSELSPASPLWARGSVVRKTIDGLDLEVTFSVQPLEAGERGWFTRVEWFVLSPRITVKAGQRSSQPSFDCFHANWPTAREIKAASAAKRSAHGSVVRPPGRTPR
jgi:hypothetical protein